ncbi:MAG: hypothetical protein Ta2G_10780 [Termitinemataceae bacterium]|nr:MAG: hypothetical protein Ta2G_10780 [Termitinemataceae bacterium]
MSGAIMQKRNTVFIAKGLIFFAVLNGCAKNSNDPPLPSAQTVLYGLDERQTLTIRIPQKKAAHAIVYIHGGFYYAGNRLWYPDFLADYAEDTVFATIDYRLISIANNTIHLDDMLADVDSALAKISILANEHDVSITDFILVGHSAGAHIALLYGYKYFLENADKQIPIAACVSLAGPSDYTDDFGWSAMSYYGANLKDRLLQLSWLGSELVGTKINLVQYNWTAQNNYDEFKNYIESISPIMYVDKDKKLPPTLLVHGIDDSIVPYSNSVKLDAALNTTDVPHELITVTGTGNNHMLGGMPDRANAITPIRYKNEPWVDDAKVWLESYLKEPGL